MPKKARPNELIGGGWFVVQRHKKTGRIFFCSNFPFEHPSFLAAHAELCRLESIYPDRIFTIVRDMATANPPEGADVVQINDLKSLSDGWDGEQAKAPIPQSVDAAIAFVRGFDSGPASFDVSLHADGTVILETSRGNSFHFLEDGKISVMVRNMATAKE